MQSKVSYQDFSATLYDALKHCGVKQGDFESLMRFIDPPPKYAAFATIAENLVKIFQHLEYISLKFAGGFSSQTRSTLHANLSAWLHCCEMITANCREIETVLQDFCAPGKSSYEPPYRDFFGTHPLFVALWCRKPDEALSRRYELVQAYLCLLYLELQTLGLGKRQKAESAKEKACLAVRKLARPEFEETLMAFPDRAMSLADFRNIVDSFSIDKHISPIPHLIKLALREISVRDRGKGISVIRRSRGSFSNSKQVISFAADDDSGSMDSITLLSVEQGNKTDIAERKHNLTCTEEFASSRQFAVFDRSGPDPSGGLSEKQRRRMSVGAASAIAMSNQRLPTDWDRLTAYEVATFLEGLNDLSQMKIKREYGEVGSRELAAFLTIAFWLSATAEDVRNVVIVPSKERCKTDIGILLAGNDSGHRWIVKPRVSELKVIPDKILAPLTLPIAKRYELPIPVSALNTMIAHLMQFPEPFFPARIFSRESAEYDLAAKEFLKDIRRRKGGRLSLERVSMHLHGLIAQLPGSDITAAISISRRNDPLGWVPLHYTSNSIERLQGIYAQACNSVLADAGLRKDLFSDRKTSNRYVGSRFVPKTDTVKDLVCKLHTRLHDARNVEKDRQIQLHNAMTVYTVMLIGYATGFRAVHDPLLQEAEIDRESGFAVISDKDDDSFYNARIVWLPEICMQQIDLYNSHLAALQRWLFGHNLQLFFNSREKAYTGRQTNRVNPALFLLQKNKNNLPVQPSYLKELLGRIKYPLPINSNRHFLRTNLLQSGCPVEVIQAFLGHWERGVEPWGRYSGLSPLVYRDELSKHLVPLLEEAGWTKESGLGRSNG
ncbi:hypothetical protein KI809_17595 [Geobacter pelophilus]|uniref:Tyr recombinase domain-containing protein n=1 Tax=Geoanaerobacter pelophilus TaxID=60036 RepID=A0AAW4LAL7_9BACT|nr:hypothetical protein [Geoanaerobacter pelophilus]MBT0666128.1 hypothetical protein [Geoanaerobacter pelophilus]